MVIKEDLLHYLWRIKNFDHTNLTTTEGQSLIINNYGTYNHSDGPDFLEAQIQYNGVVWNGSIEIHVKSSDWHIHGHANDPNFNNTILHVVYESSKEVTRENGEKIPCLELKNRINTSIISLYRRFDNLNWVPCESFIQDIPDMVVFWAKERAISDRLHRRWKDLQSSEKLNLNTWEETAYRLLCRSFGLVHNAEAFGEIASKVPFSLLKKNQDNIEVLEAIYMGVAGLLNVDFKDEYPQKLKGHYSHYKKKYDLREINIPLRHKAVRPFNFPEIALSQFINLMRLPQIFSRLIEADLKTLKELLKVRATSYWNTHFIFDKDSKFKVKLLGSSKIDIVIINAIVPILYFLSIKTGNESWSKKAMTLLEQMPAEKNTVINKWTDLNVKSKSAYDSQALLELKKQYCDSKKCLLCPIGHHIMKSKN